MEFRADIRYALGYYSNGEPIWTTASRFELDYYRIGGITGRIGWQRVYLNKILANRGGYWSNHLIPEIPVPGPIEPFLPIYSFTDTFEATWSDSYDGDNNAKPREYTLGRLYQGRYGHHNAIDNIYYNPIYWGSQRSLIGFDVKKIQEALVGGTVHRIELYLKNEHFWYVKGGKASIVSHNFSNKPSKFNHVDIIKEETFSKGQGKWVRLPVELGEQLKNGEISGFGLYKNTSDLDYYGYFSGATSKDRPKLRIIYAKNYYLEGIEGHEYLLNDDTYRGPQYNLHTVQQGETLWSIANQHGKTVSQIQGWNNLTGTLIHPGDRLRIYVELGSGSGKISEPATAPKYTSVVSGEGLVQVTERLMRQGLLSSDFNTARRTLMELNGFTTSAPMLHPGDQIMYSRGY